MSQESRKVVVIGSGIGGSAIAAMLAHRGFSVTVLEKLGFIGGRCCSRERRGSLPFRWPSFPMRRPSTEHPGKLPPCREARRSNGRPNRKCLPSTRSDRALLRPGASQRRCRRAETRSNSNGLF